MSRLEYDPMPRRRHLDASVVVFLVCLLGLALSVALLFWIRSDNELPDEAPAPESVSRVRDDSIGSIVLRDGTVMHLYSFTDPENGVRWLVNDRGGMAPRVDTMGRVMVDEAA